MPQLRVCLRWCCRPASLSFLAAGLGLFLAAGCSSAPYRSTEVTFHAAPVATVPAHVISNFFVVESRPDDGRVYRFLIDTGSTATLISPTLAARYGRKPKEGVPAAKVKVRSANGGEIELEPVTLSRLTLGSVSIANVPALVFDFSDFSAHLGVTIDGLIGFPVFRETLLTLDYPRESLILAPAPLTPAPAKPSLRGATITFNNEQRTPLIPLQMGNESFNVQIDTGSDGGLSLNPAGLHPRFAFGPRPGTLISSLQGDRQQMTGRLGQNVLVGTHTIERPIIDLTDQLSSLGGEFLRHFAVSFDQQHSQVTLVRDSDGPVTMEPRRSTGLSFTRSPVYWRVRTVIPDTPTAQLPVQLGDLCIRINGEAVEKWPFDRYADLVKSASKITYTLLVGTKESNVEVSVFELVP